MAFIFTIAAYPDQPVDFALYGALEWLATGEPEQPIRCNKLSTLAEACKLAAVDTGTLLDMVTRGFVALDWNTL